MTWRLLLASLGGAAAPAGLDGLAAVPKHAFNSPAKSCLATTTCLKKL